MGDDLRSQIYLNFSHRETKELLEILRIHDRDEWSEMTFDVIREILQERGVEPPAQGEPAREPVAPEGVAPLKPKTVTYAVYLALAGLAVRVVLITLGFATGQLRALAQPQLRFFLALLLAGTAGLLAFEAWLIYGAWLGRNRRRIVYVLWIVLSSVLTLVNGGWAQALAAQPVRAVIGMLASGADLAAVVLLLLPISNAWFREMRAVAQQARGASQRPAQSLPSDKSRDSQTRWMPLAFSFVLALGLNALMIVLVDRDTYHGQLAGVYAGVFRSRR